jgi:CRP/FNR family transcriptional regulator
MTSPPPRNGRAPNCSRAQTVLVCDRCFKRSAENPAELPPAFWSDMAASCRTIKLVPRETLLEAGSDTAYVYRVADGALSETRFTPDGRRQIIRFLHRGDLFGRLQLLPYNHVVTAVTAAEVCAFPRAFLTQMMWKYPKTETVFMMAVEKELADAERHLDLLAKGKAGERLAGFLLDQLPHGPGHDQIVLPMTRADIADYLGISTETVSRLVTQFSDEGLIQVLDRQRFHLAPGSLKDLAQDE